jgi:hypothetical protein
LPVLRTERPSTTRATFGIGRLLTAENLEALLRVGHDINQRLLDAQLQVCACALMPDHLSPRRTAVAERLGGPRE